MDKPPILIVDDEPGVRESVRMVLKDRFEIAAVDSGEAALRAIDERRFEVVLLDILMPGIDGMEVLERIRALAAPPQVIMLTATKTVKTAVQAMKLGAFDYITKPFDIDELALCVDRAVQAGALTREVETLRDEVGRRYNFANVIGTAPPMQAVLKTVERVARIKSTVLITGESGTGKEVIAKAIHFNSPRADRPIVTLNCAAIAPNLIESELFGHEKGAFTDAHAKKIGLFEQAHQGTIFLDEIGEMNPAVQAKFLRVLEQGTFTRVGGLQEVEVDVRVVAATNRDLQKAMQDGSFRPDLFYRLNVVAIHLPPLRERREDLPLLIRHFLRLKSTELGLPERAFSREALDLLFAHDWPGNVRELENVVERALALAHGPALGPEDLPGSIAGAITAEAAPGTGEARGPLAVPVGKTLDEAVGELERAMITRALTESDGNQSRAAELLGTTRRILKYKMDRLGIRPGESGE